MVKGYAAHMSMPPSGADDGVRLALPLAPGRASIDDQLLMAAVAKRYYFDQRTRVQLAQEFGISRFKVTRLLEAALSSGIVRISIVLPEAVDADLSLRLREKFGLDRALVAVVHDPSTHAVREALGRTTAALLSDIVTDDDVLGVTSGRTIDAVARHLRSLAGCEIVQLTGMSGDLGDNPVEVLRRVAVLSGGQASSIYAPLTVATSEAASALKTDPRIAEAFGRFASVTIAVAAVGSWDPPESRFYDALSAEDRERLQALDVLADVGGVLLDRDGAPVHDFDDRVLGVTADQLAAIGQVVVVGGGPRKTEAIRATLRSGLVSCLITDDSVAVALLAEP
ncbi:DNA-binding transcriptional regulator [Microlunatus lacustris]